VKQLAFSTDSIFSWTSLTLKADESNELQRQKQKPLPSLNVGCYQGA
jgi:hypothetical protein